MRQCAFLPPRATTLRLPLQAIQSSSVISSVEYQTEGKSGRRRKNLLVVCSFLYTNLKHTLNSPTHYWDLHQERRRLVGLLCRRPVVRVYAPIVGYMPVTFFLFSPGQRQWACTIMMMQSDGTL